MKLASIHLDLRLPRRRLQAAWRSRRSSTSRWPSVPTWAACLRSAPCSAQRCGTRGDSPCNTARLGAGTRSDTRPALQLRVCGGPCESMCTQHWTTPHLNLHLHPLPPPSQNSYTHRHLCEFTGLDMEMNINESYHEVRGCAGIPEPARELTEASMLLLAAAAAAATPARYNR